MIYGAYKNLQRMIYDGEFKLIYYPNIDKTRLYNLKKDPLEIIDLSDDSHYSAKIIELKDKLLNKEKELGDPLISKK